MKLCTRLAGLLFLAPSALLPLGCAGSKTSGGEHGSQDGSNTSTGGTGVAAGGTANGGTGAPGGSGANGGGSGASGGVPAAGGGSAAGGLPGGSAMAGTGGGASGTGGSATEGTGGTGQSGSAGSAATGGVNGLAGAGPTSGMAGAAGNSGDGTLGNGLMSGMGRSSEQYETVEVSRNGVPYILITNGWGPGFESHTIAWNGTSFIVEAMSGSRGSGGQPASYPSVFCGRYSVQQVPDCGLPRALDQITSLKTGWRWSANGNTGAYNAAYDIWLGTDTGFGMYLMVWLRDPPGEQPAGSPDSANQGVSVQNVPGVWDIWRGTVNNRPIINWVRHEGMDSPELEFDVMDFIRDAQLRGFTLTGTQVNAVAVGFEIWQGPITNLESQDFYVHVE